MELKIEDLKYRDILVHKETGAEYEVIGFDSNGKEIIFSSGEVANDLKYFKKKEQSQYTFDDLIDVAVRARKDGKISNLFISDTFMEFSHGDHMYDYGITCVKSGINYIQSLYKETFVIECEDDINHVKSGAIITLLNDISLTAHDVFGNYIIVTKEAHSSYDIDVLKGATVTQSK